MPHYTPCKQEINRDHLSLGDNKRDNCQDYGLEFLACLKFPNRHVERSVVVSVSSKVSLLILSLLLQSIFFQSAAFADTKTAGSSAQSQKLHRADFRVTGASCVACLRRIGKTMREQKGVLKADVSIFKPYWSIVIFDAAQTNMDKIFESVKAEKVKFEDMEDKSIDSVPVIVIPKGMNKTEIGGEKPRP